MLVDCTNCRTPIQVPTEAKSIRCALCQTITKIGDSRALPPPNSQDSQSAPSPSFHTPCTSFNLSSPSSHTPPGQPPSPHGRKKAVICGISYRNSRYELKGCINDAKCMRYLLINRFKFPEASILMLTEEETDPYRIPNNHNMRMALYWLVQGCQPGDSLVFHYSGHGSRQRNYNGDGVDGYDTVLCPLDFETQGMIVNDEINSTIVKPLPRGVKLHAIIDASHSGTIMNLSYLCRMNRAGQYIWEDHRPRSGVWKGTQGGEAISFSGCDDDQTTADTSVMSQDGNRALSKITLTGAMTFCFIQAFERGQGATYGSILNAMRASIRNMGKGNDLGGGAVTSLMGMLLTGGSFSGGLRQEPQLTANEPFDVYTKPFSL